MVPGAGIAAPDFAAQGMFHGVPGTVVAIDPGMDSYLDGTLERRLLAGIDAALHEAGRHESGRHGATRLWLAGISLGCQGILRCMRARPGLAEGAILLTPYLASTGLVGEIARAGGLRRWTPSAPSPERDLMAWIAKAPLPRILLGHARADRFAATAALLAPLLPQSDIVSVPGGHDWTSWRALWRLVLDLGPFA